MTFRGIYSSKVIKHFRNPQNMGEMKDADAVATVGNPMCGDVMKLYLKIGQRTKNKQQRTKDRQQKAEYIKDIKFQTLGCGAAIATSSILTQMVKGKSLAKAGKITSEEIIKGLGGLPVEKMHCSVLGARALKKAIESYQAKKKRNPL